VLHPYIYIHVSLAPYELMRNRRTWCYADGVNSIEKTQDFFELLQSREHRSYFRFHRKQGFIP